MDSIKLVETVKALGKDKLKEGSTAGRYSNNLRMRGRYPDAKLAEGEKEVVQGDKTDTGAPADPINKEPKLKSFSLSR